MKPIVKKSRIDHQQKLPVTWLHRATQLLLQMLEQALEDLKYCVVLCCPSEGPGGSEILCCTVLPFGRPWRI